MKARAEAHDDSVTAGKQGASRLVCNTPERTGATALHQYAPPSSARTTVGWGVAMAATSAGAGGATAMDVDGPAPAAPAAVRQLRHLDPPLMPPTTTS